MAPPRLHPLLLSLPLFLLLLSFPAPAASSKCHKQDKKALLAMKAAWGNPAYLSSWKPSTSCCDWAHVWCTWDTNRVTKLYLTGNAGDSGLVGAIPSAVGDLELLEGLIIADHPKLVGPIPSSLTRLSNLLYLTLTNNSFSGPIPEFLATLYSLEFLQLSHNGFTGSIPPRLGRLPFLEILELDHNRLTGSIPDSLANDIMPGLYLDLSHNSLTGPLPRNLSAVDFASINLSSNKLSGDASTLFKRLNSSTSRTTTVDISRNMFEFDLGKVKFPSGLSSLDISRNKIYGRIPKQVAELGELQQLDVSYNRLCGRIPTGGNMGKFNKTSYAHNRCLCGTPLPPCK